MTTAPMTRRILRAYDDAAPEHRADGERWYATARRTAELLAGEYGSTVDRAAGVIAALSPRCQWRPNVEGARRMLQAASLRAPEPVCAGTGANRRKAWAIACGADPDAVLSGPKVRAFYANIIGDDDAVTVDVWAARAAVGRTVEPKGRTYDRIAEAYRRAAVRRGLTPREMQATVWCAVRGGGSL
jgi:hypothetical protein